MELNASNLKQALLPEGADLVANPIGSAVGFALEVNDALVITTPGVPVELTAMLPEICDRIAARVGGGRPLSADYKPLVLGSRRFRSWLTRALMIGRTGNLGISIGAAPARTQVAG